MTPAPHKMIPRLRNRMSRRPPKYPAVGSRRGDEGRHCGPIPAGMHDHRDPVADLEPECHGELGQRSLLPVEDWRGKLRTWL